MSIHHFLNPIDVSTFRTTYEETNIVDIPNAISTEVLTMIKPQLEDYPWWSYFITPNENVWKPKFYPITNNLSERFDECKQHLMNKGFCYRFKRSINNHYESCYCISCKLKHTAYSSEVITFLSSIVGKPLKATECFLSCYSKDDFLSIHTDIKKGDISVTFSLSYDWSPVYGGLLHFCKNGTVYKTITPNAGTITLFKLEPENGLEHFVSPVCVDRNRYTLTAWYSFL
jgi:hypothetical protein